MSRMLSLAGGSVVLPPFSIGSDDEGAIDPIFRKASYFGESGENPFEILWPRSQFCGSLADADMIPSWIGFSPVRFEFNVRWSGDRARKRFTGVTKDANGDPLSYTVVQLFQTIDDLFITETLSDIFGNFNIYSPYNTPHYMVAYKAGATDVGGTSKNTILGD